MHNFANHEKKSEFSELSHENESILSELVKLEKSVPEPQLQKRLGFVKSKFKDYISQCSLFCSSMNRSLRTNKKNAEKFMKSIESEKSVYHKLNKKKNRIKSQEIIIESREKQFRNSLDKIKDLWQKNLSEMESSIRVQKETIRRIGSDYLTTMKNIEKEIQEVIEGPRVPSLRLERIAKTPPKQSSARSSSSYKLTSDEDDLISNRSAFSHVTEDLVSHRSNSSRPKPPQVKRINPPLPPALPSINQSINLSYISDVNESLEFEKVMNELDKEKSHIDNLNGISMEKTIGGWVSEYESEQESLCLNLNPDEIKKALMVLKKAKLLNAGGNQLLVKLAEMIKDPENSSNVELMLQLINIERKKNKASQRLSTRSKASNGKPPTPTHQKKKKPSDLVGTAREKFVFPEDKSFNRTILSTENHLSPKANDFHNFTGQDLNDVNLEDLLNVSSIMDNLGLISADTSLVQEPKITRAEENFRNEVNNKKALQRKPLIS